MNVAYGDSGTLEDAGIKVTVTIDVEYPESFALTKEVDDIALAFAERVFDDYLYELDTRDAELIGY